MKHTRNHKQNLLVKMFSTGAAFTVQELAPVLKMTETGCSALIRSLRNPVHGGYDVKGYFPAPGALYHYRMAGANGKP